MDNKIKKVFSDSLIYGFGNVVNRFIAFLLLPLYTHYFSPKEFGVFSLVYAFWFFAAIFYLYGMETAFQKFFIEAPPDNKKKIFSSSFILLFNTSLALSLVLYLLSPSVARLLTGDSSNSYLIKLLSVLLLLDTLSRLPMIAVNSLQKADIYSTINIAAVLINITSNICFIVVLKFGIEAIFYSHIISYAFILIISFISVREYFTIVFDDALLKSVLKFAHQFIYYGIFLVSLDLMDRYFLQYYKGEQAVGIYSAVYRLGMIMNLAVSGFRTAWFPFFLNERNDAEENKIMFSKILTYFTALGMILFTVVSLFAEDIVKIKIGSISILDPRYREGLIILPYILLAYFFFGLYTNLNVAVYYKDKTKYLILSSALAFVSNIIFNIILIPLYSYKGAAIATMVSYFIMFVTLYFLSQKEYKIPYNIAFLLLLILSGLALVLFNLVFVNHFIFNTLFSYTIKALSVLLLVLISFYIVKRKPANN